jgi:hypothetical protein
MGRDTQIKMRSPQWIAWLIVFGMVITLLSIGGLLILPEPLQETPTITHTKVPTQIFSFETPTPPRQALIDRQAGGFFLTTSTPTASPEPSQAPAPTVVWTSAEKNALSWLCWYEIRGMSEVKLDACLSVISTVRARYAYNNGFGASDVISTILAEGQFTGVQIDTEQPSPDPDLLWAVEIYAGGARGSCTGYFYFDSIPGGPSLCVIRASNGQFVEFHNGWK